MTHKMAASEAPAAATKLHKPEKIQEDSKQEDQRKNQPEAKTEFGSAATNQR